MLLGCHIARKPTRQSLRQATIPQEAAMATSAAANPSELDIVLFNVSGNPHPQMDIYTDLENCPIPLFVLGLDEISEPSQKALCSRLDIPFYRQDGLVSIHCRHLEEYDVSFVDQDTLETVKEEVDKEYHKYFTVARLKACVLKPADPDYGKVLLVAWSGHGDGEYPGHAEMTMYDKRTTLTKLVRFVDRLKETEGCDLVIVGGDFNMSSEGTGNILKTIKPEGEVVSGTRDEHNRHAIIYWPRNRLEYDNTNINNISRFDLQPTTDQGTEHDLHPTLGIALITDQRKDNELAQQKAMRYVLGKVKDDYTGSLFVLCQDGITGPKHKILCEKLRYDYRSCRQNEEARVYYRPSVQYEVTYVEEMTLAEEAHLLHVLDKFTVARALIDDKSSYPGVLLVSWHGLEADRNLRIRNPEQTRRTFRKLVQFLDCLKNEENCEVVVVGGNFNLPADEIESILGDEIRNGNVLQNPKDRPDTDEADYIIYWAEHELEIPVLLPLRNTQERDNRLFEHDAFAYDFELQPSRPPSAAPSHSSNSTSESPGYPMLRVLLFNLHIQAGEREDQRAMEERAMNDILDQVNGGYTGGLVVLCQGNIDQHKHNFLCDRLEDHDVTRKEMAGVYFHRLDPAFDQGEITLELMDDVNNFPLERLMACVLTAKGDSGSRLLLVSWHGPYKTDDDTKEDIFSQFVYLLGSLQDTENCQAVLAGGDFNLGREIAESLLEEVIDRDAKLDSWLDDGTKDPIDYIIYWPKSNFQKLSDPMFVCPHFTIEKPEHLNRPFDHPTVAHRLQYTADSTSP